MHGSAAAAEDAKGTDIPSGGQYDGHWCLATLIDPQPVLHTRYQVSDARYYIADTSY